VSTKTSQPTDHFSLHAISPLLNNFTWPTGDFNPNGTWKNSYKIYGLVLTWHKSNGETGDLTIQRQRARNNSFNLDINYDRYLFPENNDYPPSRQLITAQMHCRQDSLSTPLSRQMQSQVFSPDGQLVPYTQITKSQNRPEQTSPAYTNNWALYDAVQRMPRREFQPLTFTLFDHFDQRKDDQRIMFHKSAVVKIGNRAAALYALVQFGRGILPIVYWLDEQGRLLFVISGVEAYILKTTQATTLT